jgi:hypothetical protein
MLERLARKFEPSDAQLKAAGKLPEYSRVMKRYKPVAEVPDLAKKLAPGKPKAIGGAVIEGQAKVIFSDGSVRNAIVKRPAGVSPRQWKKQRKAARRLR